MPNIHPRIIICIASIVAMATITGCASTMPSTPPAAGSAKPALKEAVTLDYKKGQLFSIVSIVSKDGEAAKSAVAQYYKTAFPLGRKHGLKRDGQLSVLAVPVGKHKSEGVVFYSWPNAKAETQFTAEPAWPNIKSLRPKAWEELRIYTRAVDEDMTLKFRPGKTYTMATAWINPDNPDHYDRYMDGIKEAVTESGGRFIYKMHDPVFESNTIIDDGPGQVTLVEWDTPQGLQQFGKTDGFKNNAGLLSSGVTRFEIIALKVT